MQNQRLRNHWGHILVLFARAYLCPFRTAAQPYLSDLRRVAAIRGVEGMQNCSVLTTWSTWEDARAAKNTETTNNLHISNQIFHQW